MRPSLKARGTLMDVAKAVGVSHTTVSNAFNRPDQLSPELREKIIAAARAMKYSGPNPAARMLRTGFAKTIGMVWSDTLYRAFEDPAASAFLGGVAQACAERGLGLLLVQGQETSSSIIQTAAVDGFILYSVPKDDETLKAALGRGLPMVAIDQIVRPKIPVIGIDDRTAARACAQHLKDLGHQRFAIVTFGLNIDGFTGFVDERRLTKCRFTHVRDRIAGYLDVIRGEGLPVKIWECLSSTEEDGRIAAEHLFEDGLRPTAILAASDRLAIGVIEAARRHRIRVPHDLSVVGFDDIPAAKLVTPHLTTVHQPFAEKGRMAVSALLDEKAPLRRELPATLEIRRSTASPPSNK
ncbi:MAG TPA: LacI family DNA-binding transcriptional regulator [Chthoniobacterales bacterium]